MIVQELPASISGKKFKNLEELLVFIQDHQIITSYGEISPEAISPELAKELKQAQKMPSEAFVNL